MRGHPDCKMGNNKGLGVFRDNQGTVSPHLTLQMTSIVTFVKFNLCLDLFYHSIIGFLLKSLLTSQFYPRLIDFRPIFNSIFSHYVTPQSIQSMYSNTKE